MKNKNNVTRNKLLLCFKPVVLELESKVKSFSNNNSFLSYMNISMNHHDELKLSDGDDSSKILDRNGGAPFRPKRTLSKIIKAVLFQTSMSMKIRDRKIRQNSFRSMSNLSTKTDDSNTRKSINLKVEESIESNPSPCTMPESNTNNSPTPDPTKNLTRFSSHNSGLYLILISLAMTIFWGKLCAVLLTSTWLYFDLRRRKIGEKTSKNDVMTPEMMRSKEYKKIVIMEGLLEKNHHHDDSNKEALNSLRENSSFRV